MISVWPETFKINEFLTKYVFFFKFVSPRSYRLMAGVMSGSQMIRNRPEDVLVEYGSFTFV